MKKSQLLILGLIALMLAGGLALASCKQICTNDCRESRTCGSSKCNSAKPDGKDCNASDCLN